ncbi:MAG: hypothetical protein Q8930_01170 [Bacillota bacterium]|nr:hypothetical protein [Bacillota bacterium]
MATITSEILIGHSNDLSGGIIPTHILLLSEGSKPVWILKDLDILEDHTHGSNTIRWIPTTDNVLEDALLMISIYVLRDKDLVENASKYFRSFSDNIIELSRDISIENLKELYRMCRRLQYDYKLILSCFTGSSLEKKLNIIKLYSMDIEVCKASYNRSYNPFGDKVVINGNL